MLNIDIIESTFLDKLKSATTEQDIISLKAEFLGRSGLLTTEMKSLSLITQEERKSVGQRINKLKDFILDQLQQKHAAIEEAALDLELFAQSIDITLPTRNFSYGTEHPISKVISDITEILRLMGFVCISGPEIEDDWHNFTALNIPESHPARQSHDTFYIKDRSLLLRTHTSSVEIRHMQNNKPPIKILSIGKVYRADYDATHTPMFHQAEGLYIAKDVEIGHLKWCLTNLLQSFFGFSDENAIRFRSSYFPFTSPSFEVDIRCDRSARGALKIGKGDDWLEVLGCGMTHPKVLQNVGIDSREYRGFAFGAGIERLAMLKYQIADLRKFFDCDMRWLSCFKAL
ncbi:MULTISPECIES: phenylalanine--tRNA ligase subunit alpha [unclassified Candidatus Lariskella]|uniref:phenylalanine--tRNA ligase subunit alpha n=1 Tax=unclassified Candidatus Lariskella TaxID=2632605 RepID=UPI0030D49F61